MCSYVRMTLPSGRRRLYSSCMKPFCLASRKTICCARRRSCSTCARFSASRTWVPSCKSIYFPVIPVFAKLRVSECETNALSDSCKPISISCAFAVQNSPGLFCAASLGCWALSLAVPGPVSLPLKTADPRSAHWASAVPDGSRRFHSRSRQWPRPFRRDWSLSDKTTTCCCSRWGLHPTWIFSREKMTIKIKFRWKFTADSSCKMSHKFNCYSAKWKKTSNLSFRFHRVWGSMLLATAMRLGCMRAVGRLVATIRPLGSAVWSCAIPCICSGETGNAIGFGKTDVDSSFCCVKKGRENS